MEETEFKTIKLLLCSVDSTGNTIEKIMPISVTTPKIHDKRNNATWTGRNHMYSMDFKIVIPDHIHAYLEGKTIPVWDMNKANDEKKYALGFPKTLKSYSLQGVISQWNDIIDDAKWLKDCENIELDKVIFYEFDNKSGDLNSQWNGSTFGLKIGLKFSYSVAFISKKGGRYTPIKRYIGGHDKWFYDLKFVKWSEEREAFFNSLYASFNDISTKINQFEASITEDTINHLITNNKLLLN